jgi:hypothetical protein
MSPWRGSKAFCWAEARGRRKIRQELRTSDMECLLLTLAPSVELYTGSSLLGILVAAKSGLS